jgi:hypothetical protein
MSPFGIGEPFEKSTFWHLIQVYKRLLETNSFSKALSVTGGQKFIPNDSVHNGVINQKNRPGFLINCPTSSNSRRCNLMALKT